MDRSDRTCKDEAFIDPGKKVIPLLRCSLVAMLLLLDDVWRISISPFSRFSWVLPLSAAATGVDAKSSGVSRRVATRQSSVEVRARLDDDSVD